MEKKGKYKILEKIMPDRSSREFIIKVIESLTNIVLILNSDRRLVYANQSINGRFAYGESNSLLNLRPGDIFQCVNSKKEQGGCGASKACEFCGAFRAMDICKNENKTVTSHYRILGMKEGRNMPFNFRFTATPFECSDGFFYVITLEDISIAKRKAELEKIFYHDLMNTVGNMNSIINLIKMKGDVDQQYLDLLETNYNSIYDTINEQKQLSMAERGELKVNMDEIHPEDLLIETMLSFKNNENLNGQLTLDKKIDTRIFVSDQSLLQRILVNMIKNALEASEEEDKVVVGTSQDEKRVRFWVNNRTVISEGTKHLIFERSFSTKGTGRGLGTYSMKILGEDYLGGTVDFISDKEEGTTFWIDLPKNP